MATCTFCGAQIPDGVKFCTSCGGAVPAATEAVPLEQAVANANVQQPAYQQPAYQQPAGQQPVYQQPASQQQGYQQQYAQPATAAAPVDSGSAGWAVLGFFIPLVGLILFLVWRTTKPNCAKMAGIGAIVGFVAGIIAQISMGTIHF